MPRKDRDNGRMEAPSLSSERARELAALRRRAYGPAADIDGDAAALDRLQELEALERRRAVEPADPPVAARAVEEVGEPVPQAIVEETPDAADAPEVVPPWWRRVPIWAIAGAGVVVGVLVGIGAMSLAGPRPDATLRVSAAVGADGVDWENDLSSWGLVADTARSYGDYDGLGVWVIGSDDGSSCVLLEDDGRPITVGCVGGGLDPILDVTMYPDMERFFDTERPTGSVTRFIARGDVVEVWERRAQESAAGETSSRASAPSAA